MMNDNNLFHDIKFSFSSHLCSHVAETGFKLDVPTDGDFQTC